MKQELWPWAASSPDSPAILTLHLAMASPHLLRHHLFWLLFCPVHAVPAALQVQCLPFTSQLQSALSAAPGGSQGGMFNLQTHKNNCPVSPGQASFRQPILVSQASHGTQLKRPAGPRTSADPPGGSSWAAVAIDSGLGL